MNIPQSSPSVSPARIASLDQFRGYTVAGMFLVNFVGGFAACPRILRHTHDYCSYADTIMPQFLFAVGFAFRLTFERRVAREGKVAAYSRVVRRLLGLAALAFVVYVILPLILFGAHGPQPPLAERLLAVFKRDWFQTLLHIAVTSLWILPVVRASAGVRIAYAALSAVAHVVLSAWFYFDWVNSPPNGVDGGPLGFLTWSIPAIAGTLACDIVTSPGVSKPLSRLLRGGVILMFAGWFLSCGTRFYDVPAVGVQTSDVRKPGDPSRLAESPVIPPRDSLSARPLTGFLAEPPFVPPPDATHRKWNYWMMSQRAGSLSYLLFSAGFSLVVFAVFYLLCDRWGWKNELLETLGVNALAGYVIHDLVGEVVKRFAGREVPSGVMWTAFAAYFAIVWGILRLMERRGIFWRM